MNAQRKSTTIILMTALLVAALSASVLARESSSWEIELQYKLNQRVTFDFDETPLYEALDFIRELTDVNIVLDPMARKGENVRELPVTLKVSDMKLRNVLKWVLRTVDLAYVIMDEAIYVTSRDRIRKRKTLVMYDVRDLFGGIRDYHAPRIAFGSIGVSDDGGVEWEEPEDVDGAAEGRFESGEELVEFIIDILNLDEEETE